MRLFVGNLWLNWQHGRNCVTRPSGTTVSDLTIEFHQVGPWSRKTRLEPFTILKRHVKQSELKWTKNTSR